MIDSFKEWMENQKTETTDTGQVAHFARPVMPVVRRMKKKDGKNLQKLPLV